MKKMLNNMPSGSESLPVDIVFTEMNDSFYVFV